MKVCIVSFSGRPGGNCSSIAEILQQRLQPKNKVTVYDFSSFSITSCGYCNYECFQANEKCPYICDPEFAICDAITNSDLTYFVIPNYCDYPCSNFYIFNERSQCYFQHHQDLLNQYLSVRKKFIVVSNTGQDNFITAFRDHIPEGSTPDILFLSAIQFHKQSIHGDLMNSTDAKETLFRFSFKKD